MQRNPIFGVVAGAAAIMFSIFSMATRREEPPPGYALLDYGLIALGVAVIIGSLISRARQGKTQDPLDR